MEFGLCVLGQPRTRVVLCSPKRGTERSKIGLDRSGGYWASMWDTMGGLARREKQAVAGPARYEWYEHVARHLLLEHPTNLANCLIKKLCKLHL